MTIPDQNSSYSSPAAKPEGRIMQKNMTKAERRELQEKQRAAKLASKPQQQGKQTPQTPSSSATGQPKIKLPPTPQRKILGADATGSKHHMSASRDFGSGLAGEEASGKSLSHGLRIFSHFGQHKSIGHTKGDIHPAIIRLGLLFSEFRICGANARCIATLTAFKKVSPNRCLLLNALNLLFIDGFR
jgi:translation initiation factor eIF-2B subunit delta